MLDKTRNNIRVRTGLLLTVAVLVAAFATTPVLAMTWSSDVHTTVTATSTYDPNWSSIYLSSGKELKYTISVTSGASVSVYILTNSDLRSYESGSTVYPAKTTKSSSYISETYTTSTSGYYALLITSTGSSSTCKTDITLGSPSITPDITGGFWEAYQMCIIVIIIVIVIVVFVIILLLKRSKQDHQRQMQGPQPYGGPSMAPAPSYGQPGYGQSGYGAPPAYGPTGYGQQSGYSPPPAPPVYSPSPSAAPTNCKYCGLQVPPGANVCPRCGGYQ